MYIKMIFYTKVLLEIFLFTDWEWLTFHIFFDNVKILLFNWIFMIFLIFTNSREKDYIYIVCIYQIQTLFGKCCLLNIFIT